MALQQSMNLHNKIIHKELLQESERETKVQTSCKQRPLTVRTVERRYDSMSFATLQDITHRKLMVFHSVVLFLLKTPAIHHENDCHVLVVKATHVFRCFPSVSATQTLNKLTQRARVRKKQTRELDVWCLHQNIFFSFLFDNVPVKTQRKRFCGRFLGCDIRWFPCRNS